MIDLSKYSLIRERRNQVKVYLSEDGSHFLRIGPSSSLGEELKLQLDLLAKGFPVARVLDQGQFGDCGFYQEVNLGANLGEILGDLYSQKGTLSSQDLHTLKHVTRKHFEAQKSLKPLDHSPISFQKDSLLNQHRLEREIQQPLTRSSVEKVLATLALIPHVWSHGDFNPHNISERGIYDFEYSLNAPLGYDLVSSVMNFHWFPISLESGPTRTYELPDKHIEETLDQVLSSIPNEIAIDRDDFLVSLYMLRALWLCTSLRPGTPFQKWRWDKLDFLLENYLEEKLDVDIFFKP